MLHALIIVGFIGIVLGFGVLMFVFDTLDAHKEKKKIEERKRLAQLNDIRMVVQGLTRNVNVLRELIDMPQLIERQTYQTHNDSFSVSYSPKQSKDN